MEKSEGFEPMLDFEFSRESLEQIDRIYHDAAKYYFFAKEEFEREFMRSVPAEIGEDIAAWRRIADAFLLYTQRHADGEEIENDEGGNARSCPPQAFNASIRRGYRRGSEWARLVST